MVILDLISCIHLASFIRLQKMRCIIGWTNYMEDSLSWEANTSSASQNIRTCYSNAGALSWSQEAVISPYEDRTKSVYTLLYYFWSHPSIPFNIHFNIILPSKAQAVLQLVQQNPVMHFCSLQCVHMPRPPLPPHWKTLKVFSAEHNNKAPRCVIFSHLLFTSKYLQQLVFQHLQSMIFLQWEKTCG